jgi:phosphomannomutase
MTEQDKHPKSMKLNQQISLRQCLAYKPQELQFGTSDRRGEVIHLTQLEVFINAVAELEFLQALPKAKVGLGRGEEFFYARDLRPSSSAYVAEQLAVIQKLYDKAATVHGQFDAVVSTDGDSDRPLMLGVDAETSKVRFFGGDLVGMLTAELLSADAVVVPISSNDAIDRGKLKDITEPKTRIGSPYVIAGMEKALARGKKAVCGWEANGGFLTGSDILWNGQVLKALPTRDAVLPILAVLFIARREGAPLTEIFTSLPKRYSRATLIEQFPRTLGLEIVKRFSPSDEAIQAVVFLSNDKTVSMDENNKEIAAAALQKKP